MIRLPEAVYVAELTIDDKKVIAQGKAKLNYGGKARSRKSVVKMALLLNDPSDCVVQLIPSTADLITAGNARAATMLRLRRTTQLVGP